MSPTSSPSDTSPPQMSGKQSLILEAVTELKRKRKLGMTIKIVQPGASVDVMTPHHSPPQKKQRMFNYRFVPDCRMFRLNFVPLTTIPEESVPAPERNEDADLYTNIDGKKWRVTRHTPTINICQACDGERLAYKSVCHNIEHAVCIVCARHITNNALSGDGFLNCCPLCKEEIPDVEQRKEKNETLLKLVNKTRLKCIKCPWRGFYTQIDMHTKCPTTSKPSDIPTHNTVWS